MVQGQPAVTPTTAQPPTLTVLGGKGFIGHEFARSTALQTISNARNDTKITQKDVVNFVGTIDNFNVINGEPFIDIGSNLIYLVMTLNEWRHHPDARNGCYNFISTWMVYGGLDNHSVSEEKRICIGGTRPQINGFHSITKAAAEALVIDFCGTYNLPYRIIRLGSVIGMGDKKVSETRNPVQFWINKIKNSEDIVIYDGRGGMFYRDFITVHDAAHVISTIVRQGGKNEIFNVGNGKPDMDVLEILEYMKEYCNSTSKITLNKNAPDEQSFYFNIDKIKALGYKPWHERKSPDIGAGNMEYRTMFTTLV